MAKLVRNKRSWAVLLSPALLAGLVVPLVVLGGSEPFTATPYADVIRFEAQGVASLQVEIFDLSGRRLWDSGVIPGPKVDWNRSNLWGERLAYGTYLYQAKGWDSQGKLALQKSGKLFLLPGDKVQLQAAPVETEAPTPAPTLSPGAGPLTPKAGPDFGADTLSCGHIFITPSTNTYGLWVVRDNYNPQLVFGDTFTTYLTMQWYSPLDIGLLQTYVGGTAQGTLSFQAISGNVAIGTTAAPAKVSIRNTVNQPALRIEASSGTNLIECYNTGTGPATGLIFRVERATGDVRADGAFYGAGFFTGSADVAEHINASEELAPGDVVEIDPAQPRSFRRAQSPYSRLVAGIISSRPGVVLGSNSHPVHGEPDPRPMLALAGRVPVKATTENGPIAVGDLLVSSSRPGYAMRLTDPEKGLGAVIGKALEPLEADEGMILVQVTLR